MQYSPISMFVSANQGDGGVGVVEVVVVVVVMVVVVVGWGGWGGGISMGGFRFSVPVGKRLKYV